MQQITKSEFDILDYIVESGESKISQRKISSAINVSLGTVNKIISNFVDNDVLEYSDKTIILTNKGLDLLEPYRAKRAILLAAGFGSRMLPITLNTPKPLVRVHGKRIIETIIDALIEKDITEIYVVRGYLGETFDLLKNKYPNITLIDNPMYNETNNLSSAYLARDKFQNAYVCESDLLLKNPNVIRKYQYGSNYTGKYVDVTNDWCFETNKNGFITNLKIGGEKVYHTYCIAYFDEKDGKQMEKDIEKSFEIPGAKEKVWDFVALDYFKENYSMYIREVNEDDIVEIDSFNELKSIDKVYDVK